MWAVFYSVVWILALDMIFFFFSQHDLNLQVSLNKFQQKMIFLYQVPISGNNSVLRCFYFSTLSSIHKKKKNLKNVTLLVKTSFLGTNLKPWFNLSEALTLGYWLFSFIALSEGRISHKIWQQRSAATAWELGRKSPDKYLFALTKMTKLIGFLGTEITLSLVTSSHAELKTNTTSKHRPVCL